MISRVPATRSFATGILAATLLTTLPIAAQEIVDLTGRDQRLNADFEEIFRVGVLNGESWEMFGAVRDVAFDASGNLYLFDGLGGPARVGRPRPRIRPGWQLRARVRLLGQGAGRVQPARRIRGHAGRNDGRERRGAPRVPTLRR